jgi:hypothetical protein
VALGNGFYQTGKVFQAIDESVSDAVVEYLPLLHVKPKERDESKYKPKCAAVGLILMKMIFPGKTAEFGVYTEGPGSRFHSVRYAVFKS